MRAARMHGYNQPLVLEDVRVPEVEPHEVLVRVGAAGMCRTDVQLLDGYFRPYADATFPLTPGHEIAGEVDKIGSAVPKSAGLNEGDQVVVVGGWGDETCRHCYEGTPRFAPTGSGLGLVPTADMRSTFPYPSSISSKSTSATT
jgi:propanol-preferring alcohol dehydrogenase